MKVCTSCSSHNDSGAAFCIQCGMSLAGVPAREEAPHGATERFTDPAAAVGGGFAGAGSQLDPYGHLPQGTIVDGKYTIERVLGEGGMGIVYLARDIHTETRVVVKAIRSEFAHNTEYRSRILAEGRALARIDHPNVVRLNAIAVERGELYLVMQFIEGQSLDHVVERSRASGTPIPFVDALRVFRMILAGVGAAHQEGVIHRDLKPANILLRGRDGVAKVTDFGIAKGEEDAKAGRGQTQGIIGSLSYMAPEQVRGAKDLDKRVDIYALGILLFELLVGRVPFDAPSDFELMKLHTEAPLPSVQALRTDIPPFIDGVLARACAKDRHDRFSSCDDFLRFLDQAAALAGLGAAIATGWQPPASAFAGDGAGSRLPSAPAYGESVASPPVATERASAPAFGNAGALDPTAPDSRVPVQRAEGSTHQGASLSALPRGPEKPRRTLLWTSLSLLVVAGAGVGLFAAGVFDGGGTGPVASATGANARGANTTGMEAGAGTGAAGVAGAAGTTGAPKSPLEVLAGNWKSDTNRDYQAILLDDVLEFRIVHASQFPRQGYHDGEARFALRDLPNEEKTFAVEDRIRPVPPAGIDYDDARSRGTCQEAWTAVGTQPLRARYDGKMLTVDLAKIETGVSKFVVEGKKIVGCQRLRDAPAEKISSMLTPAAAKP